MLPGLSMQVLEVNMYVSLGVPYAQLAKISA